MAGLAAKPSSRWGFPIEGDALGPEPETQVLFENQPRFPVLWDPDLARNRAPNAHKKRPGPRLAPSRLRWSLLLKWISPHCYPGWRI